MKIYFYVFFLFLYGGSTVYAQGHLNKKVRIQASQLPLKTVLKQLEQQGNFSFSYKSTLFDPERLVSVEAAGETVLQVLDVLFNREFTFQSRGRHIIIQGQTAAIRNTVSGYVFDQDDGQPVAYASVYEPEQLIGTMTNTAGYFRLALKPSATPVLRISKVSYQDTLLALPAGAEEVKVRIQTRSQTLTTIEINAVERNWLARQLLSSGQLMSSMNLKGFLARQPLQVSVVPGLGSHGRLGAQVINKFSFNILGGYTAGVRGFELGGLFNIVKQDMQYVQIGGLFNLVGGHTLGVQVGGLYNSVKGRTRGVQVAGLYNAVTGPTRGVQVAGLANIVKKDGGGIQVGGIYNQNDAFQGIQIGGIGNVNKTQMKGLAIAGIFNKVETMNGIQLAAVVNKSKSMSGLQIGLINIADTNQGLSIGLLNLSRTGYHKIATSVTETGTLLLAFKSGNSKLYSIVTGGLRPVFHEKLFAFGYGMGSDLKLGKKGFYFNPELIHLYYYNGNWARQNLSGRLQLHIKYAASDRFRLYTGPALNVLYSRRATVASGYLSEIAPSQTAFGISRNVQGWLGWSVGFELF